MARILRVRIRNYRSIGNPVVVEFPPNKPLVLLGQNNAGKSNIIKGIELLLGQTWAGTHDPDEHEFFGRDRDNTIDIRVRFDPDDLFGGRYDYIMWRCEDDPAQGDRVRFRGHWPGQDEPDGYIRNQDRDTCACVVLEAERNLRYQLGYSSKWTYLSRLMHRFHGALNQAGATKDALEQLFGEIKARFHDIPEFAAFVAELQSQFGDLVGSMTHKLDVDFEAYNPVNFFHALRLQASENGEVRTRPSHMPTPRRSMAGLC